MIESNNFFTEPGAEDLHSAPDRSVSGQLTRHDFLQISAALNRITASAQPADFLPELLQTAIETVRGECGYLLSCDPDRKWKIRYAFRRDGMLFAPYSGGISDEAVKMVLNSGQPQIGLHSELLEGSAAKASQKIPGNRSLICVPLRTNNTVVGAIYIDCLEELNSFNQHQLQMLNTLAERAVLIKSHVSPLAELPDTDISVSHTQEERQLKQLYSSFIDSIPAPLLIVNRSGDVLLSNRIYRNHPVFSNPRHKEALEQICCNLEEETKDEYQPIEIDLANQHFLLSAFPTTENYRGIVVHELVQRCKKCNLDQSESVSKITGGVAHEIKNALAPAMGRLQLLEHTLSSIPEETGKVANRQIAIIQSQLDLIASIVDSLTDITRPRQFVEKYVNLPDLLETTLETLRVTDGQINHFARDDSDASDYFLLTKYSNNLPAVSGDSDQLQQLFSNLILNAVQALEVKRGGAISIQVNSLDSSEIEIVIADTGVGMDSEMQERIWEPWYTTKADHGGSGLGMMIIKTIVEAHRGRIRLKSWPGSGTRIHIMLPAAQKWNQLSNSSTFPALQ